ncbi:MAG: transposase, partial [Planctomycetota bacterium]
HSVGVKRQWCGRLGKRENCQVGVFMAYATSKGHGPLDRRLFLPEDWAEGLEHPPVPVQQTPVDVDVAEVLKRVVLVEQTHEPARRREDRVGVADKVDEPRAGKGPAEERHPERVRRRLEHHAFPRGRDLRHEAPEGRRPEAALPRRERIDIGVGLVPRRRAREDHPQHGRQERGLRERELVLERVVHVQVHVVERALRGDFGPGPLLEKGLARDGALRERALEERRRRMPRVAAEEPV